LCSSTPITSIWMPPRQQWYRASATEVQTFHSCIELEV
jgi:hypothetical protein